MIEKAMTDGAMKDHPAASWRDLCLFLGGSDDSFTGVLLTLVAKADPGNRERLRKGFPRQVAAWEAWCERAPYLTFGELEELTRERAAAAVRLSERYTGAVRLLTETSDEDLGDALLMLGADKRERLARALGLRP